MMRMTVLASGSRGNCTVVSSSRTRILVDAGISCRELFRRMQQAGEDPCTLDAILITHEHQDHVQGLSVAARKLGIPVYFTEATHRAWLRWINPRKRMTYADWLAQRQQEAAARRETLAAVAAAGGARNMSEDNPFYREQGLKECALELEELGGTAEGASLPGASPDSEPDAGPDAGPSPHTTLIAAGETPAEATSRMRDEQDVLAGDVAACDPPAGQVSSSASRPAADPSALPGVEYFRAGAGFSIGDIQIMPFTIPHDAADPVGFVLEAEGIRVGIATDLGYMPANVSQQLRGCDIVMLESNHDLDMLRDGPYPWSVKQRVLSRVGHLSNAAAAEFLEKGYDGQAAYVVLAHISESNNLPELARLGAEFALRNRMSLLANKLVLAAQHEPTESIYL